jgi:uncharacterized protein (TIGR03437 family)
VGNKLAFLFFSASLLAYGQGAITAKPAALTFTYEIGASLPTPQTVALKAGAGTTATAAFSAAIPPGTSGVLEWITVTPTTGNLSATLTVRVNPITLNTGQYTASVNVSVLGVVTTIPVILNVVTALPTLTISPANVNLSTATTPVQGTVTLTTTGTAITFTASVSGAAWLTLNQNSTAGVVLPGGPVTLTFTADPTTLSPQSKVYSGKIVIVATGVPTASRTQTVIVNFTVDSSLPTITQLWPNPVQANSGAVTLWITGTNLYAGTTVKAGNTSLTPTLLSPTQIQVVVPASLLTVPGTNVAIVLTNPLGGGSSAPASLNVTNAPTIQAVLNAASYAPGSVSPGEIVALFGPGIGPPNPVYMTISNGYVNQNVGGLLVIVGSNVNGYQSAPLLYADQNQVTVQIPYSVQPGLGQTIQVSNGTVVANLPTGTTITVGVNAPGIFTADGSGIGQAAAEVYSGASGLYTGLNSASNQTTATDTVVLYLTGEGEYLTPAGAHTGYIVPPPVPPATLPPQMPAAIAPTVTIGGVSAPVVYAGAVEGSIIGLLQVNVTVPSGIAPGNPLVVVTFPATGNTTQDKVTLAVK